MAYNLNYEDLNNFKNEEVILNIRRKIKIHKNVIDYEQISQRILKDYRNGKIGKYVLEFPEDIKKEGINEFKDFNLSKEMLEALEKKGFVTPSEIQKMVIPELLKEKHI